MGFLYTCNNVFLWERGKCRRGWLQCMFHYTDPSILRPSGPYPLAVPVRDREPVYPYSDPDWDYDAWDPDSNFGIIDRDTEYDVLSG